MIKEYENTLRTNIGLVLGYEDSTDYGLTPYRIEKWKERREAEKLKIEEIQIESRLIFYTDIYDLGTIGHRFWEKFKPVFHDKKRFEVFFKEVEDYKCCFALIILN